MIYEEYDFIELIKNNVYLENKEYNELFKSFDSEEDYSDDDIIL